MKSLAEEVLLMVHLRIVRLLGVRAPVLDVAQHRRVVLLRVVVHLESGALLLQGLDVLLIY